MVTDFVRPESMEVPEGGLASFLTATVGEWADATQDDLPQTGIAGVKSIADQLADYGRYEDTYMIHAAEGETVVPMAVLDGDPRLKASLFAQMRAMGLDPQRYVVGNELNSINPVTGQPEFFLKSLWKGLKKAVKGVVKVVKKLAPVILSVGLSTLMGPIAGTALGSGIGTLIQGGNFKDALKMAAIGGVTVGLFKGIGGGFSAMKANQGFGTGFRAGVASGLPGGVPYDPTAAIQSPDVSANLQPKQALLNDVGQPIGGPTILNDVGQPISATSAVSTTQQPTTWAEQFGLTSTDVPGQITQTASQLPTTNIPADINAYQYGPKPTIIDPIAGESSFYEIPQVQGPNAVPQAGPVDTTATQPQVDATGAVTQPQVVAQTPPALDTTGAGTRAAAEALRPPTTWESVKDIFTDTGSGKNFLTASKDFLFPSSVTPTEIVAQQLGVANPAGATFASLSAENIVTDAVLDDLITKATSLLADNAAAMGGGYNPGFLQKWGPLGAAGMGIMAATGGFEEEPMGEVEEPWGGKTGWDLLKADPAKYSVFPAFGGPYSVPGGASGGDVQKQCVAIPHRNTGGTFPPRDGAIAGPGTGTSDDIPAMLSDGEFVMTARAVEGAGNGDRRRGVRKMYEVMRGFEGVA